MGGQRGEAPLFPPYGFHSPNKAMALTFGGRSLFETAPQFRLAGGQSRSSPPLLDLHRVLGQCLASLNLPLDPRPFSPHITLTRRDRSLMQDLLETFTRWHSLCQKRQVTRSVSEGVPHVSPTYLTPSLTLRVTK